MVARTTFITRMPRPVFIAVCLYASSLLATVAQTAPPDLTAAGVIPTIDRTLTYNLGATGLRGWIYTKAADNLDAAQGRTTRASRQILVTHVGAASPADGVVRVDDVIVGVRGKPFADDARKSLARAIQEAETGARGGVLKLLVSREGQPIELALTLASASAEVTANSINGQGQVQRQMSATGGGQASGDGRIGGGEVGESFAR